MEQVQVENDSTQGPIVLKGCFLSISLPSESLMKRRFTDEEEIIDEITKEFNLIPQRFISRFATLRSDVYEKILPLHTLKLQRTRARNVYLLPLNETPAFLEKMRGVQGEFSELQEEIDGYLEGKEERFRRVQRYTDKKGLSNVFRCPDLPGRVHWELTPVQLSHSFFEDFLAEEEQRAVAVLREELERSRSDVIAKSVGDLQVRLGELIQRLAGTLIAKGKNRSRSADSVQRSLTELEGLCASANLAGILGSSFRTAILLTEAVKDQENSEQLETTARSLAVELGYRVLEEDPGQTLSRIALGLKKDLSPRVKALMEELL